MRRVRIYEDIQRCKFLWRETASDDSIQQLWEVRKCFQDAFHRTPCFLAYEDADGLSGLLPLSQVEETGALAFFPGETWRRKTWLEQNRIFARSPAIVRALLDAAPSDVHARYLQGECIPPSLSEASVDEVGYLFSPRLYGFSYQTYLAAFPRKTLKHLLREPNQWRDRGAVFRYGCRDDIERLFHLNLEAFGEDSYFYDERFLSGFERLVAELDRLDALRVTTVLVAGEVAAVNVGAAWRNTYTVLAGGTNRDFPGVAKLINFHHVEAACSERFELVDFLCGDFGWKSRFRLTPRPLYEIRWPARPASEALDADRPARVLVHAS